MTVDFVRYFAITALIGSISCTIVEDDDDDDAGTAGTGGHAGSGGSAGTAGYAGSSGYAGAAGTGGDAGSGGEDAGVCLGDTLAGDAGLQGACDMLSVASANCSDAGNGGLAPAYHFCLNTQAYLRTGVLEGLLACFDAIPPATACSDAARANCVESVFARACPVDSSPCADVASKCNSVPESFCDNVWNSYLPQTRSNIMQCFYERIDPDAGVGSGDCATDFEFCYSVPY